MRRDPFVLLRRKAGNDPILASVVRVIGYRKVIGHSLSGRKVH
jgi:hypothetical protein